MPISAEHVGRTYPPTGPYEVTRAKIAEFAAALGQADTYGGPRPEAPPTFGVVVTHAAWGALFADPELDVSLSRTIHGDQRFSYVRPLRAGDVVTATVRIEKVQVRGGSERIGVVVAVQDEAGDPVLSAEATLFHSRGTDA